MSSRVDWEGDKLVEKVTKASAYGVDKTLALCVGSAKRKHEFTNRTGVLEGSIQSEAAKVTGSRVVGRWGSFQTKYAIYIEAGTSRMPARPFLRPAADEHYRDLATYIREGMERAA